MSSAAQKKIIRLKCRQEEGLSISVSFLPFDRNIIFRKIFPQATFLNSTTTFKEDSKKNKQKQKQNLLKLYQILQYSI